MAKKRRPRNRIEVDVYGGGRGWPKKYRATLHVGKYTFDGGETSSKRSIQCQLFALHQLRLDTEPLPVEWSE